MVEMEGKGRRRAKRREREEESKFVEKLALKSNRSDLCADDAMQRIFLIISLRGLFARKGEQSGKRRKKEGLISWNQLLHKCVYHATWMFSFIIHDGMLAAVLRER